MQAIPTARPAEPGADMQAFLDTISAGDVERAGALLAENVLVLLPGLAPVYGRRRVVRLARLIRRRFADVRWTQTGTLDAEPGWLISTWTMAGTLAGGASLRREVASVARLDVDGKIAYLSDHLTSAKRASSRRPLDLAAEDRPSDRA